MLPKLMIAVLMMVTSTALANDYDIKMVHFLPAGETSTAQERENIRRFTRSAQNLYRNEMARHGYANKTFTLDHQVYVVEGRKKPNTYTSIAMLDRDFQHFRDKHGNRHGYLVFVKIESIPGGWNCGVAGSWNNGQNRGDIYGGRAYIAYSDKCLLSHKEILIGHEIGHVFGLRHDLNQVPNTIMTTGKTLSPMQADWLSVSHYFQRKQKFGRAPELKHQHGFINSDEDYIVIMSVEDDSGLHYAQLWYDHIAHFFKLQGQNDIVVFQIHAHSVIHNKLNVTLVDIDGNRTYYKVPTPIDERHELRTIEVVKKPAAVKSLKLTTKWASIKADTH